MTTLVAFQKQVGEILGCAIKNEFCGYALARISSEDLTSATKSCIRNDSDGEIIDKLNLPAGLKELVAGHGFTINQLLCMKSGDISDTLRIDQDAARLIVSTLKESRL